MIDMHLSGSTLRGRMTGRYWTVVQ